jgi:hypothetical protein
MTDYMNYDETFRWLVGQEGVVMSTRGRGRFWASRGMPADAPPATPTSLSTWRARATRSAAIRSACGVGRSAPGTEARRDSGGASGDLHGRAVRVAGA